MNPILFPLASVHNVNGIEKSGYAKIDAVVILSFKAIMVHVVGSAIEMWHSSLVIGVAGHQELSSS